MDDIFSVGDRVIVLKRGKRVGMRRIKETSPKEVVRLIVAGESEEGDA
jgi:simple sugar transport system ATP-binding protein